MTVIATASLLFPGSTYPAGGIPTSESFANFVKMVGDSMVAAGWVNTQASGSINTGSIIPPGSNAGIRSFGYQVFRMNDTLHTQGYPVFIRFDYGGEVNVRFTIAPTVAFTHDGSGSVGGYVCPLFTNVGSTPVTFGINNTANTSMNVVVSSNTASGSLYDHRTCIISGGDMSFIMANNLGGAATFMFVERTKDVTGNPTNEGVFVGTYNGVSNTFRQSYLQYNKINTLQTPSPETFANFVHSGNTTSRYNNTVNLGLVIPMLSYGPHNPLRMVGFVKSSDFVGDTTHTMNVYNSSSTYFVSANTGLSGTGITGTGINNISTRLAVRSE